MDPMGYIVYNSLLRIIIVSCNFQLYTIVVIFQQQESHFPKNSVHQLPPRYQRHLRNSSSSIQTFNFQNKSSKLQKKILQKMVLFHHFFSLFRCFFPQQKQPQQPHQTFFLEKKVEPSCRRRVLIWVQVLKGFVRFFCPELGAIGKSSLHRQHLEDRSPPSVSG